MLKVVIKGYYGFGNFGDDILMLTSYFIIKEKFISPEVFICTESKDSKYVHRLLKNVKIISNSTDLNADVIVQGGGGVYFDFQEGSLVFQVLNSVITLIGYNKFKAIYKFYQFLLLRPSIKANKRVGIGIGIGAFTKSSRKFYSSILTLADFDLLFVRDNNSFCQLENYNFKYKYYKSTDIAFLRNAWLTKLNSTNTGNIDIGIILRDWPYDNHAHINAMLKVAEKLTHEGKTVSFFSFDSKGDRHYIELVSDKFDIHIWKPEEMTYCAYISKLSGCSFVISSRAHGAIICSCLGIPGICIEIEPKLKNVQQMLPNSYSLITGKEEVQAIIKEINQCLAKLHELKNHAYEEVDKNEKKLLNDLKRLNKTALFYEK